MLPFATKRTQEILHNLDFAGNLKPLPAINRRTFFGLCLFLEAITIIAIAVVSGVAWHGMPLIELSEAHRFATVALMVVALYELPLQIHSRYRAENDLIGNRGIIRLASAWTQAFLFIVLLTFLSSTSDELSRGWLVLFYLLGLLSVIGLEMLTHRFLSVAIASGRVQARRLLVIGPPGDMDEFQRKLMPNAGIEIAASAPLPENCEASSELRKTVASLVREARQLNVSDVVVLPGRAQLSQAIGLAEPFLDLPVAVHLGNAAEVELYPSMHSNQIGRVRALTLRKEPLSLTQAFTKRLFDVTLSSVALLLLAPLMVCVAVLIRLDSPGPIFFRQRRRGLNQKEFLIWKYRTMSTMDDGEVIVQATRNDARLTRIGRSLRKYNIDELPQLLNVMQGSMSLVGPRPHAVAHDNQYEQTIKRYTRRLTVKPGITGWAQIHGLRGPTKTDDAMRKRLNYDLEYIENWSLALDVYILLKTVLSPNAYKNAF